MKTSLGERLMAKVVVQSDGCWMWTGSVRNADGYGQIWTSLDSLGNRQLLAAHRASYEIARGKIPDGLDLDHLCRVRRCVNPDHLEPVTRRENVLRGDGPAARNARKTHCSCGQPLVEHPGRWANGKRFCEACHPVGRRREHSLVCVVCSHGFIARKRNARCCSNACRRVDRLTLAV